MSTEKYKSILLITYYWPPSGGPGVQRQLKFAKYLSKLGHRVIVYTPENGEYPSIDKSLFADIPKNVTVIKRKIFEPYKLFKKLSGRKKVINPNVLNEKKENGLLHHLSIWIRGNLFIPDARILWVKPSVKYLTKYLKKNHIDTVITSGPPHSLHLIGLKLKEKHKLKWIADFRDPWTEVDYFNQLLLTKKALLKHIKLEKKTIETADLCITVTESWKRNLKKLGAKNVECIHNGYDEEDFKAYRNLSQPENKFIISHVGQIFKNRNYEVFWKAISEIINEDKNLKNSLSIQFIGTLDESVFDSIKKYKLSSYFTHINNIPHSKIPKHLLTSHLLYLPLDNTKQAQGKIPAKFFEYIASENHILVLSDNSTEIETLDTSNTHFFNTSSNSLPDLKQKIQDCYHQKPSKFNYIYFSRLEATKRLVNFL
ncbi:MAG: glycosyltransferase [Cyclobacteriaceae bacterium]